MKNQSGTYRDLELVILPGKPDRNMPCKQVYESYINFWKEFWQKEMVSAGGDASFVNADDVFRQYAVILLLHNKQIVASMMCTNYDLHAPGTKYAKYFSLFNEVALKRVSSEGSGIVNTMEYLAVHPDWRKSRLGFPLGPLVVDIGFELGLAMGASVHVGVARVETKVNSLLENFGGISLGRVKKVNIDCEIMAVFESKRTSYVLPVIREAKDYLFLQKTDAREGSEIERIAA
jgi:hypothetical protein